MRALIIGIDGQDGYYLTQYLLGQHYEVYGVVRKKSGYLRTENMAIQRGRIHQIYADMTDYSSLFNAITEAQPDEIYNLAGQSDIPLSWVQPTLTAEVNALGVMRLLEIIRVVNPKIRLFQASSSEIFGSNRTCPLDENSECKPRNPYGTAKLYAHWCIENYRNKYGLYACSGILFNHESPRRGVDFVTRKITMAAAAISLGKQDCLELGDIYAVRDWGYAGDYVRAMHIMLQQRQPEDYVIATGIGHTVKDFTELSFQQVGIRLSWEGTGFDEVAKNADNGRTVVRINPSFHRNIKNDCIIGNPSKAREKLGFTPEFSFEQLVKTIVDYDVSILLENRI